MNSRKNIQHKIEKLLEELQQVDSIYLLNILNQKLIHSIHPEPTDLPDGFTQQFHFLCGLIVSSPITQKSPFSNDPDRLDKILNLTNEIFEEYANLWLSRPSLDGSDEKNKVRDYSAGLVAFLTALHEPKLGSTEQFMQLTLEQFEPFDDQFLVPSIGLTTQQILDISLEIVTKVRDQYEAVINDYADAMQPIIEAWKALNEGHITLEESARRAKKHGLPHSRLQENESMFLEAFSVSDQELKAKFGEESINAYFDIFAFTPGSINTEFRLPTDFNELELTPFMQVGEGKYFAIESVRLLHSIPTGLERLLTQNQYAKNFFEHRDKLTQKKAVELLKSVFTTSPVYENAYYGYNNSREFETDILIPVGRTLLICEVKAKALRSPLHTEGNIQKIKKDFKVSIQKGYDQALRTLNYICSNQPSRFVSKNGRLLFEFENTDFDEYQLLIVTQESFSALATDLSVLLSKTPDDPYPVAISLFDLELLVSRLNEPSELLKYLYQRRELHGHVFSHDELDYAGYYLSYGNLDFSRQLKVEPNGLIVLGPEFSKIFDLDWFKKHGFNVENDTNSDGPYFSVMRRHGDEVDIGVAGNPDSFRTVTIGGTKPERKTIFPKLKGRNRNEPCPCGSGLKYKKCCGKGVKL